MEFDRKKTYYLDSEGRIREFSPFTPASEHEVAPVSELQSPCDTHTVRVQPQAKPPREADEEKPDDSVLSLLAHPLRRGALKCLLFRHSAPTLARSMKILHADKLRHHLYLLLGAGLIEKLERPQSQIRRGNKRRKCQYQEFIITAKGRAALTEVGELEGGD